MLTAGFSGLRPISILAKSESAALGPIDMSARTEENFGCFHYSLGERGMRMNCHGNIAGEGAHFDGEDAFGNEFASPMADDADAENALGLRIDDKLGDAVGAVQREGAAGCAPGKFGDFDLSTFLFRPGFRSSRPKPLRDR